MRLREPKPMRIFWAFPIIYFIVMLWHFFLRLFVRARFVNLMCWLGFVTLFYLGMRLVAVKLKPGVPDTEILNNPYLLADGEERSGKGIKGYACY